MATVAETIKAKLANLDAAYQAEKASLEAALTADETWLGQEVDKVKAFFAAVGKHLGL